MASETLWTGFNNRKLGAERAKKDEKGRNLADSIDRIPGTYVSAASVSSRTLSLTVTDQTSSPTTTTTVSFTDTGDANVQSDWAESDSASDAYIANKPAIVVPLASATYAAPTNIVVVTAMPSSPDPTTIYLVKDST
jgi:hypothetical protein